MSSIAVIDGKNGFHNDIESPPLSVDPTQADCWHSSLPADDEGRESLHINHLPPEILTHVFSLVPGSVPGCYRFDQSISSNFFDQRASPDIKHAQLARLMTVCRYWHQVVLAVPSLWSTISEDPSSCERTRVSGKIPYLDRSGTGPLDIYIHALFSVPMFHLLKEEGSRIRQLRIHGVSHPNPARALIAALKALPAVQLKHCTIDIQCDNVCPKGLVSLFSGHGEALRSLHLENVPFLLSNPLPRLTSLVIKRWKCTGDPSWTLTDLRKALAGLPMLRELHLCNVWGRRPRYVHATDSEPRSEDMARISLPHLAYLTLQENGGSSASVSPRNAKEIIQEILSLLAFPPTCQLDLDGLDARHLSVILASTPYVGADVAFTRMRLQTRTGPYGMAPMPSWWSSPDRLELVTADGRAGINVRLRAISSQDRDLKPVSRFLQTSPFFAHVEELWVLIGEDASEDLPSALLASFPRLRRLAVHADKRRHVRSFLDLLAFADVCPLLDTLCVQTSRERQLYRAAQTLSARMRRGSPIRWLFIGHDPTDENPQAMAERERGVLPEKVKAVLAECVQGGVAFREGEFTQGGEPNWILETQPGVFPSPVAIQKSWPFWCVDRLLIWVHSIYP